MSDLRFTKEGVPIYDGTAESYVPYRRAALNYVETLEWKKRSLAGPRLQAALEGTARIAVQDQVPGWISHDSGALQLLNYLKSRVQPPTLAEAGKMITRFFYSIKRRRGESMNNWILRHDEALFEARRTLAEAIHEYGSHATPPVSSHQPSVSRLWETSRNTRSSVSSSSGRQEQEFGPFDPSGRLREDEDDDGNDGAASHHEDAWSQWYQDHDWHRNSWWDSSNQWWNWQPWPQDRQQPQLSSAGKYDVSLAASDEADKFLPDFVVAWMLLQRSGLDGTERGAIIANLKNQFTTSRVKEALRLNWPEEDLRKRDQAKGSALLVDEDFDDALLHEEEEVDLESLDDESREEYGYLIKDVESAFQAFQGARRTLKEAREKQSMFRKSRQFFPVRKESVTKYKSESKVKCFKCGGQHHTSECPDKHAPSRASQSAHLAFSAFGTCEPHATGSLLQAELAEEAAFSLRQILDEGKAIIDGGATSSVGSVSAMDQIVRLNAERNSPSEIEIVKEDRPNFRFGNNGRTQCMSTALLDVKLGDSLGKMKIHVHNIEGQPVLMSIASLRALGAVIDFDRDEAIFKKIDPCRVISLERAPSGHQLFPLTEDILSLGVSRVSPFLSLHDQAVE